MAMVDCKGLHTVTSKGRIYHYAWRGGPRIEAEIGTKAFFEEFTQHTSPHAKLDRKRIATWIILFKASPEYAAFSKSTKASWTPKIDDARRRFGHLTVVAFNKPEIRGHIKHWREQWRTSPRMADMAKQALSRFCAFMVEEGALSINPCEGIANLYSTDRSDIIWTPEDIETFAATAPQELVWAVRLAALTGLRQGALLQLPWGRIAPHYIDMTKTQARGASRGGQGRGGKGRGLIPKYPALKALLETMPRRAITVLTNTNGDPWKSGFKASFGKAMRRSGLAGKDLHFHDLRGTAATNFYRAGLASGEIAEIMGWKEAAVDKLLDIYVRRDVLILDRIRRMEQIGVPELEQPKNEKTHTL